MTAAIRVLVVDDSVVARQWVVRTLETEPGVQVVGVAANGEEGLTFARRLAPDVITLDVEMPILDGIGMLRRLMAERPTPVIMVSSLTTAAAAVTIEALELGAIDFVTKPSADRAEQHRAAADLRTKVLMAGSIAPGRIRPSQLAGPTVAPRTSVSPRSPDRVATVAHRIVVLCTSTGGPTALRALIPRLSPALGAAVIVIQHMPAGFTEPLAARLDAASTLSVQEAVDGQPLVADRVVVAPGDRHLMVSADGLVRLSGLPRVNGVRPSADITLQSIAGTWRERVLVVVMTGLGSDGREGARAVKANGGTVISQDESSSLVHGMPGAVIAAGLADAVLPLDGIPEAIAEWSRPDWPGRRPQAVASTSVDDAT